VTDDIITAKYHRVLAIDRGNGTEYVRWTAWEAGYPNRRGYGRTEEEAKNDLASFCPVVPEPPPSVGGK